jgi:hypothetical protein
VNDENPEGFYELFEVCRPTDEREREEGVFYIDAEPPASEVMIENKGFFDELSKMGEDDPIKPHQRTTLSSIYQESIVGFGWLNDLDGDPIEYSPEVVAILLKEDTDFFRAAMIGVSTIATAQTKTKVRKLDDTKN